MVGVVVGGVADLEMEGWDKEESLPQEGNEAVRERHGVGQMGGVGQGA